MFEMHYVCVAHGGKISSKVLAQIKPVLKLLMWQQFEAKV